MTQQIRTRRCPNCFLCGATGHLLYSDLSDRLCESPGVWQIQRCSREGCGLLWLDPMPQEEDLPLLYQGYYTHLDKSPAPRGFARRVVHWIYRALLWVTGLKRQRDELFSLYLRGTQPGRLLDVGCGDGGRLACWRTMGWEVEGQEIDATAAERARTLHGLRVHLGALSDLALPDSTFDVVTVSHVIEHVHDPISLLKECHRILKPGGKLIAVTPNVDSLGYHHFGSDWLWLDPPRHLHLFSRTTLGQLGVRAGFHSPQTWTTAANAQSLAEGSLSIAQAGRHRFGVRMRPGLVAQSLLFQFQALTVHLARRDSGEECVLNAVK